MMFAAQSQTRRLNPIHAAMRWLVALILAVLAVPAQGEIAYVLNISGVSRGEVLSGSVDIRAQVLGEADVVLFELSGPKSFTVARHGATPSFMVDPNTGENMAFDTTSLPNGRYRLRVTAVVEKGQDRSRVVRFRINNTLTKPEQMDTLVPVERANPQRETDEEVQVEIDPAQDVFEDDTQDDTQDDGPAPARTRSLVPQVVVVNGSQEDDGLVTVLGNLQQAVDMPEVSFRNAPAQYTRGSNQPLRVLINGAMPADGDVLAIAWSVTENRMVDDFAVHVDLSDPAIPAAQLDMLPAGKVEVQLLVRESSQIHRIIRHSISVVVPDPAPAPVALPTVGLIDPPAELTFGQTRDLRIELSADLPEGAELFVLAWSLEEERIVDEFTRVLDADLRIPASALELLPAGSNQIQVLTRLDGEVVGRTTHTLVLLDPPAPPQPEPPALPAVGFDGAPGTYTLGSDRTLTLSVSGPMPDDADVVVVAWSVDEQRMVDEFAHTLSEGVWTITSDKLEHLPTGVVNLQLLVRRDNQVNAIVSHQLTIEPEPVVVQPQPEPEATGRPAFQFGQTPAGYTLGSGQPIAINATGPFLDGGDLLVIAWSSAQQRLVEEFAFTMSQGTLAIPASKLDLLPEGEVVLQLLPREDAVIYGQITHTLVIRAAADSGAGEVIDPDNNTDAGGTEEGADGAPDGTTDGGTDPETEPEPEPQPEVYNLAFASGAAGVYQRGSGVSLPLTVSQSLPGGSTVRLRAWSLDDGAYVAAFDTTLGSAPWRVGANKLELLSDGRYRIDAALRVEGQSPIGVSHNVNVLSPSGEGEEVSPGSVYSGFTTFQPSADTAVIYVSSSNGNDDNDGLTPQTAVRTPARGIHLLRDGKPDWLLFRRGDTFRGGLDRWRKSGRSENEPMVIGSYGDANLGRPKFLTDGDGLVYSFSDASVSFVVLSDLHASANERDPDSPDFEDGRSREFGVRWSAAGRSVRFENLLIEFYAINMGLGERHEYDIYDLTVHRCVFRNAYSPKDKGHSEGFFADRVQGLVITESIFDHNGWNEQVAGAERTGFNHNAYIYQCRNVLIEGNVFSRASNLGLKLRCDRAGFSHDIEIRGNLFFGNLTGLSAGSDPIDGDLDAVVHERLAICGNVFTDNGGALPNGVVLGVAVSVKQVGDTVIEDNLFIDKGADTNWYAIEVKTHLPMRRVDVRRNIIHRWDTNEGGTPFMNEESANELEVSGNLVRLSDDRYVDAVRSVQAYWQTLGGNSPDGLIEAMSRQTKGNWSETLCTSTSIQYLREGFDLRPFD